MCMWLWFVAVCEFVSACELVSICMGFVYVRVPLLALDLFNLLCIVYIFVFLFAVEIVLLCRHVFCHLFVYLYVYLFVSVFAGV